MEFRRGRSADSCSARAFPACTRKLRGSSLCWLAWRMQAAITSSVTPRPVGDEFSNKLKKSIELVKLPTSSGVHE